MPRRSNRQAAQLGAAAASEADWAELVNAAGVSEQHHHIMVVCLQAEPTSARAVELFCFTASGNPIGTGSFRCEDGAAAALFPFDSNANGHPISEVVFEEVDDDTGDDGIIVGIKNGTAMITAANLDLLRSQF